MIYSRFQEAISDKFLDENDTLTILSNLIPNINTFDNSVIFIDEFSGFTPQEYRVIEELLKVSKDIYVTICTDKKEESGQRTASLLTAVLPNQSQGTDIFYANKITEAKLLDVSNRAGTKVRRQSVFR